MCNDIELFANLIMMTKYMSNLWNDNFSEYTKCFTVLADYDKFKTIKDIKLINNIHISKAIKEILDDENIIKIIKEETKINIQELD